MKYFLLTTGILVSCIKDTYTYDDNNHIIICNKAWLYASVSNNLLQKDVHNLKFHRDHIIVEWESQTNSDGQS